MAMQYGVAPRVGESEKGAECPYLVQSIFLLLRLFAATCGVVDGVHELVGLAALFVVEAAAGGFENAVHGWVWGGTSREGVPARVMGEEDQEKSRKCQERLGKFPALFLGEGAVFKKRGDSI